MALGVAPLSGMATIGTTEVPRPARVPERLWQLVDGSVAEYRGDALAPNLMGTPFMARTGALDRVIDPRSTWRMAALLRHAGARWTERKTARGKEWTAVGWDATVAELEGREHWWWETERPDDGGAMDDSQMRSFWARALAGEAGGAPAVGEGVRFVCVSLASCGSRSGVRMLHKLRPGPTAAAFTLRREPDDGWLLQTDNVARLSVTPAALNGRAGVPLRLSIDGRAFHVPSSDDDALFCRTDGSTESWQHCGHDATCAAAAASGEAGCCRPPDRPVEMSGPVRRVLASPFSCVYGTGASDKANEAYRKAALAFANSWAALGGGVTVVVADAEAELAAVRGNLILFGGTSSAAVTVELAPRHPHVRPAPRPVRRAALPPPPATGLSRRSQFRCSSAGSRAAIRNAGARSGAAREAAAGGRLCHWRLLLLCRRDGAGRAWAAHAADERPRSRRWQSCGDRGGDDPERLWQGGRPLPLRPLLDEQLAAPATRLHCRWA